MKENLYTIPVNEAFEAKSGCPLCRLYSQLEQNEIDRITGPAMMEPDVRQVTNEQGFCRRHLEQMRAKNAVLPLALMLSTHAAHLLKHTAKPIGKETKPKTLLAVSMEYKKQNESCYVCKRIDRFFEDEIDTIFRLYKRDSAFRLKFEEQPLFCLPHAESLLNAAGKALPQALAGEFASALTGVTAHSLTELKDDLEWFCKKFDYRNDKEDWKNSRDSIERAMNFLGGKG